MKLTVEMNERGEIRVTSDQEPLDVADASFLLDMGKMYIQSEWLRVMEDKGGSVDEPTVVDE